MSSVKSVRLFGKNKEQHELAKRNMRTKAKQTHDGRSTRVRLTLGAKGADQSSPAQDEKILTKTNTVLIGKKGGPQKAVKKLSLLKKVKEAQVEASVEQPDSENKE